MDVHISTEELLLRLALSLVFSSVLGWERERKRRPAGLRTHMLVCLGATTYTIIVLEYYAALASRDPQTNADPLRVVEGIAGGIGFIGAGAIIQSRLSVKGVTTAASIWMIGGIGAAVGGGHYLLATAAAFLAFTTLFVVARVERLYYPRDGNIGTDDDES